VRVLRGLAEDLRGLARARAALDDGRPLPLALKEARAWGIKERLFERALPALSGQRLAELVVAASVCDGITKGLKHAGWPHADWAALRRLVLMVLQATAPQAPRSPLRLALQA
jgi:DNA polymerase-3 subunit delta